MNTRYAELLSLPEGHALAQTSIEDFQDEKVIGSIIWLDEIDEHQEVITTHQVFDGRSIQDSKEVLNVIC